MEIFNKMLNSDYLLSSLLFGTSIFFYYHKINYQYIKKLIIDKIEDTYKITNTNDSIDIELILELKKEELEKNKNNHNDNQIYNFNNKFIKKTIINDNFSDGEFDYFHYCNNQ
jgi:hypothetical protein